MLVVYKQTYIAKDENQPDSEQVSHVVNYIVKHGLDNKVFVSNGGTNRYIFHRAKSENLSKKEFQKLITALFSGQGTIDKIELKEIVLKKKTITIQEQEEAIKRFL